MMTLEHSQLSLDNMMSSAEAFPVNQYQWQEIELESQKNPDQVSFTNSCESYAWYDQDSLSWKTWQRSLIMDWTSFSESFPKQGTMQNGQLYLRVHWEPVIEEADGGVSQRLPTPTARDYKGRTSVKWNEKYGPKVLPDVLTQIGDHMSVSPYFVEEMMGYPIGWTELKPSEIQ